MTTDRRRWTLYSDYIHGPFIPEDEPVEVMPALDDVWVLIVYGRQEGGHVYGVYSTREAAKEAEGLISERTSSQLPAIHRVKLDAHPRMYSLLRDIDDEAEDNDG